MLMKEKVDRSTALTLSGTPVNITITPIRAIISLRTTENIILHVRLGLLDIKKEECLLQMAHTLLTVFSRIYYVVYAHGIHVCRFGRTYWSNSAIMILS